NSTERKRLGVFFDPPGGRIVGGTQAGHVLNFKGARSQRSEISHGIVSVPASFLGLHGSTHKLCKKRWQPLVQIEHDWSNRSQRQGRATKESFAIGTSRRDPNPILELANDVPKDIFPGITFYRAS